MSTKAEKLAAAQKEAADKAVEVLLILGDYAPNYTGTLVVTQHHVRSAVFQAIQELVEAKKLKL